MAITFNTKTFSVQSQSVDYVDYLKDGSTLAEPYRVRVARTLPKNTKNAVLRGSVKFTRTYLDADGVPQIAIVTVSSSIPATIPVGVLTDLKADVKAAAAVDAVYSDPLFSGKIYVC